MNKQFLKQSLKLQNIVSFLARVLKGLYLLFLCIGAGAHAALVSESLAGLVYQTYANEGQANSVNTVPDFSRAGYQGGGAAIPFVPSAVTVNPSGGNDTSAIQNAINTVSALPLVNGFRGAVYLSAGDYTVSSTLNVNASGVVIRGAGQQDTGGTRITYTATVQSDLFVFNGNSNPSYVSSSARPITDAYVPVGSKTINVSDASPYSVGDLIRITNLMNQLWIDDIGMTVAGGLAGTPNDPVWEPSQFQLRHFRYVAAVNGNELTLDAPIVQVIEDQYGGGEVRRYTFTGAIENVGIEAIRLESSFTSNSDEDHGWRAIEMRRVVNGWVRQVTSRYFGMGLVLIEDFSQFITVEDSACLDPKSQTTGGRKYSFQVDDSSYALFQRCLTRGGRHDYVSGSKTPGPNVFVDSLATQANSDIGPHFRYATGELYDNIKSNNDINVQNRVNSGTTHGWSGAQVMFWNVDANNIRCDAPNGAMNWSVGAVGNQAQGNFGAISAAEPFGIWESHNTPVIPRSLYYAQLQERLGAEALREVIVPQQLQGRIWTQLENWDGDGLFLDSIVGWVDDSSLIAVNSPVAIKGRIRDLEMLAAMPSTTWSQLSGPGAVGFGDSSILETTASFATSGRYTLQVLAEDGVRQITGTVVVDVVDPSDHTPPAVPTGLVATPGFNSVSLNWDDNGELDLVGYTLYRSETSQTYGTPIATAISLSEYVDTTALNGTTYFYVATASDVNGNASVFSSEVTVTPVGSAQPPTVSFNFPLDGAIINTGSDLAVQVEALDVDGNITRVELYLNGQLIRQETAAPYDWGAASQNDPLLQNMVAGSYELEAIALDNEAFTTSVSITINVVAKVVPPAAPLGLLSVRGDASIYLDWADSSEGDFDTYFVYRSTVAGSYGAPIATGLSSSTYQDASVRGSVTYYYTVSAIDTNGNESTLSNEVSTVTQEGIDFGTESGKVMVAAAGFAETVPPADSASHVADAYRIESGAASGFGNFAFLRNFTNMGAASRSDFSISMEARLVSRGSGLNNNYRYGVTLFSDGADLEGSGIQAQLRYDDGDLVMELRDGLNETLIADQIFKNVGGSSRPYDYPEEESYIMEVRGTYTADNLDLVFALGDGAQIKMLSISLDATQYTGTFFGGAARMRSGFTVDFDNFSMLTEGVDTAPARPSAVVASPGNSFVSLDWDDNGEADLASYNVYRSTTANTFGAALATGLVSSDYEDTTAVNGTTYFYAITASDQTANESAISAEVSATPNAILNVEVAAIDSAFVRRDHGVQDASEALAIKRNDWGNSFARIAYLRFPLGPGNRLGGIAASGIDSASLDIFITGNQGGDTFLVYGLLDRSQSSGSTLSESSWTSGTDGTSGGGNNLQGSKRPDGEFTLPNANTTGLLGSLTFTAGVDTGLKSIAITDLSAFRDFISNDTNGEITFIIRGTLDGDPNQIASIYNSSGHPAPSLSATGEAPDNDGIDDAWENTYFGSNGVIDGSLDTDGDGVTDFFEYLYGSIPTDAFSSGFRLGVGFNEDGDAIIFDWVIDSGFVLGDDCQVHVSPNLSAWDPLPESDYTLETFLNNGKLEVFLKLTEDYGAQVFLRLESL